MIMKSCLFEFSQNSMLLSIKNTISSKEIGKKLLNLGDNIFFSKLNPEGSNKETLQSLVMRICPETLPSILKPIFRKASFE